VAGDMRLQTGDCSADELERLARKALPLLEALGDDDGLVHVWHALGWVSNMHSQQEGWGNAIEQTLVHARRAGHNIRGSWALSVTLAMGPKPTSEALAKLDSFVGEAPHPGDLELRGFMLAMLGRVDEGWAIAVPANERLRELGLQMGSPWLGELALIGGDLPTAADYLRDACDDLEKRGAISQLSTYTALLGRVLCALGHTGEAEEMARKGRELGDPEDVWTQALWRQAQALVHSARREHEDAIRLAREAVDWFSRTDSLLRQGDAQCDLAEVLEAAGRRDEAVRAWREALDRYERKQVVPLAARVRERIAALEPAAT